MQVTCSDLLKLFTSLWRAVYPLVIDWSQMIGFFPVSFLQSEIFQSVILLQVNIGAIHLRHHLTI